MKSFARGRFLAFVGILVGLALLGAIVVRLAEPHASAGGSGVGGPFALTSQDGETVTQQVLQGHPTLVFFGYTHCPDVCPATLAEMSAVFKALGSDEKARALFITVDPERDTPVVLKDYLTSFDPRITALTGPPAAIASVEREYKVYAKPVPDRDGTYTMDHTAITYLMDKNGAFVGAFDLDQPAKQAAAELKTYF